MAEDIAEAATTIAEESPEAAGLMAALMEQNYRHQVAMLPTWEQLQREREQAYERGVADGRRIENARLHQRIFGYGIDDWSAEPEPFE